MKPAPKPPKENSLYRRRVLERAHGDVGFQQEVFNRCKEDPIWYIDVFGWTYSPKDYPLAPNRPFILYDYQEEAVTKLIKAITVGHDLLIEKSRDMGATWIALAVFEHRWHFHTRQSFLIGSRKEELVDKSGDPKSLFWKLDYLISNQPGWLQPNTDRIKLHLHNKDNNSTIDGESTNDDFARGDRRTAILLDEFPAVENGFAILNASRDATNCRLFNGTPQGANGAYYDTRRKMERNNPERIVRLHWSKHPEKSLGLYSTLDGKEGSALRIIDQSFKFPAGYAPTLDGKLRSPWYDEQCNRAANQQEIAQELDIDYAASGWQFFEPKIIEMIEDRYARPPSHRGELTFSPDGTSPSWSDEEGGRLQLWFDRYWTIPELKGHAPARREFVVGTDVATGKGGEMSSNSVLSIVDKSTGEKVGQFTSSQTFPQDLAVYAVAICHWLNEAFLIWEENGPGGEFSTAIKELKYRNIFYREDETTFIRKKTAKPGWWSGKDSKRALLSNYRKALMEGTFANRCREAIRECGEYIHHPNGTIVHARSTGHEDPTASGENHGDMVIADALANRALADVPVSETAVENEVSPHSFLGRRLESLKQTAKADLW